MTLIRRKPSKPITTTEAGKYLGCVSKTVKRIAKREGWKMWRNGDGKTNPWLLLEAEVIAFRQERESK